MYYNSSSSNGEGDNKSCPTALPQAYYKVSIDSQSQPIPDKILIRENGDVVYDDCVTPPMGPSPAVFVSRVDSELKIRVNYYNSKNEPSVVSLEVIDQLSCNPGEKTFFTVNNENLVYKKVYPYGQSCVAFEEATVSYSN